MIIYIIFGDVLEHLHNPQAVIRYCRTLLEDEGYILTSIPNLMHISVMKQLLSGHFIYEDSGLLDRTHIHFFTYKEIVQMFMDEDFQLENVLSVTMGMTGEDEELMKKLLEISQDVQPFMYQTFQYKVAARKIRNSNEHI